MNDTKITKERVQHHFAYSWWKYVLLAVFAVFGWNMIYTMTKYQAPPDKRLGVYFVTHSIDSEALDHLRDQILSVLPELEDASCASIVLTEQEDYYATMQLSTYVGAGEGDIYIMGRKQFAQYASNGLFMALDDAVETGAIKTRDINTDSGYATVDDTGVRALCGIPAAELYGFFEYGIDNRDLLICVTGYSKNQSAAVQCVDWLVQSMKAPKPEWLEQAEAEQGVGEAAESHPSY